MQCNIIRSLTTLPLYAKLKKFLTEDKCFRIYFEYRQNVMNSKSKEGEKIMIKVSSLENVLAQTITIYNYLNLVGPLLRWATNL